MCTGRLLSVRRPSTELRHQLHVRGSRHQASRVVPHPQKSCEKVFNTATPHLSQQQVGGRVLRVDMTLDL